MGFELLLPVVLFILTLIIIFLLRSDDKRNQRLELMKQRTQALLKNVENSQNQFKDTAQKVEERISKKIEESNLLMGHVDSQLADLEARSEDLGKLQKVLTTYQASLTQLENTTVQVENRVSMMKGEISNLVRVQESLDSFDLRFEQFKESLVKRITEGEDSLRSHQVRIKEMQSASFAKLQEYEKEVQQAEQDNLAQIAVHTETLKNRQEASLALVSLQASKLRQLSDEGEQQVLEYEKAFQASQRQASESMQEQQREFAQLQASHIEQRERQEQELRAIEEEAVRNVTDEMQNFVKHCNSEMAQIFDMTLKKTNLSFQNMIKVVSQYLKELSLRLEQAGSVTQMLDASEHASLLSFKEDLTSLLEDTLKGEEQLKILHDLQEEASSGLGNLHQEAQQLQEKIESLKTEKLTLLKGAAPLEPSLSVVFAMALEEDTEPVGEEVQDIPEEEPEALEEDTEPVGEEVQDIPEEEPEADPTSLEKRKIEYLSESEEEEIILDEEEESSY